MNDKANNLNLFKHFRWPVKSVGARTSTWLSHLSSDEPPKLRFFTSAPILLNATR